MTAKILVGADLARTLQEGLRDEAERLGRRGVRPGLGVVLVVGVHFPSVKTVASALSQSSRK